MLTITVAVIILTGVLGNMFCEIICKVTGITHPVAKGLQWNVFHAIGTARANTIRGSRRCDGGLSIVISGMITLIGTQIFAGFI